LLWKIPVGKFHCKVINTCEFRRGGKRKEERGKGKGRGKRRILFFVRRRRPRKRLWGGKRKKGATEIEKDQLF
jgi:hypothetical protein